MRDSFGNWELFNIAADIEVNQYIQAKWRPPGCLLPTTFPKAQLEAFKGTKYYYEKLQQNLNSKDPDPNLQGMMGSGLTGKLVPGMPGGGKASEMHKDWKSALAEGLEKAEFEKSHKDLMESQLAHQLKDCADNLKSRGSIPGELASLINELCKIKEQVFNWKAYFRRFMGASFNIYTKKSFRAPSNRFEDAAGLKIKKKHHILVAIDTSGSVSDEELLDFFSEIHHIWKTGCSVEIIECDARIHRSYIYNGKFDGKITGRGGTCFNPVIEYYNNNSNKYTVLIYFTDGYGEDPIKKPNKRAMWVITSTGKEDKENTYYPGYKIQIPKNRKDQ
jgi:predicted metal-dependent peptidase